MINKLFPKKLEHPLAVRPNQKAQNEARIVPKSHEARTVLESNPYFHVDRLQNMMTPSTQTPQPKKSNEKQIRTVLIGPDIEFDGSLGNCDEVVIEGNVRATIATTHLIVKATGTFNGNAEVEKARIEGQFEGNLTANTQLLIHQTGTVAGEINYAQLEVSSGGILRGNVNSLIEEEAPRILAPSSNPKEETKQP